MAERRVLDEVRGESYQVVVGYPNAAGEMALNVRGVREPIVAEGKISRRLAKELKHTGGVHPLGEGLTIQYGIFRTCGDFQSGYMMQIQGEGVQVRLFLAAKTLDWLMADPDEDHRLLQEARPAHRYGAHVAERFGAFR